MNTIQEIVFDWLFNAAVQIGLFTVLAAALSAFTVKAKAKYQHCFYVVVIALCLVAPIFNTLSQTRPSEATIRPQQPISRIEQPSHFFWMWNSHFRAYEWNNFVLGVKTSLILVWQMFFLYQLIHFSRGIYRVHRLRRGGLVISPKYTKVAGSIIESPQHIVLLESGAIDDPVTVGLFHPAIILPSKVIPVLDEPDFAAILAHEYAHIRRKDFLVHILCQLIALPMAWHPGVHYLMAKISQTRELACDEYAAVRLGKPMVYARSLLRLASLCLHVPRSSAMGLGIFNADNLEDRIMMLTEKRTSLSRASLIGLALATTFLFSSGAVLAHAVSLQEVSAPTTTAQMFAGTWHWMFHGRSFATMILVQNGSGITGTVTGSRIALDDAGELSKADPSENSAPSPITKTKLEGNALHVTVMDDNQPFEFILTLKDATHAEIHPIGAPPNMKPIQAEKLK